MKTDRAHASLRAGTATKRGLANRPLLGILLLGALVACSDGSKTTVPRADEAGNLRYGQISFKPCALSTSGARAVEAQCATVPAPENHDAPQGRKIDLAVALVQAASAAEPDPIVFIAGGPGQSALESYPMLHEGINDALRTRNVLLIDARGTGGSHPLKCPREKDDAMAELLEMPTPEAIRAHTERCRDALSKDSDLRYYTTADHIRDIDMVRGLMGIEKINLLGVSYGTRVAQQYAKRYPQRTRTVTLDSVAPNALVLGQDHARNLQAALKTQLARCGGDKGCSAMLGKPEDQLAALRARLRAGGLPAVNYRDAISGEWREETPTEGHLGILLRLYAYQPETASVLPWLVAEAAQGRYESLLAQARMIGGNVSDAMADGMGLSVSCSEDTELKPDPADAGTVLGTEFVEYLQSQCALWPKRARPDDFRKPLGGDVPVLAISGEFDPVTPPRYGDEVVKTLPNGRHVVLPGQGHSVLTTGCMPKLFAQFVETTDAKALDTECLQRLKPAPPFAGNYGWEP